MNFKKLLAQSILWRGFYFFSVLLVNVFLSRYLKAAGTGNLYFSTIIFSFMQVVLGLGIEAGITYFGSAGLIQRNKLVTVMGIWCPIAGLLMSGIVYLYTLWDNSFSPQLLLPYCIYGFCFVCGQSLMNGATSLYYTQGNYILPNFLLALVNFLFVFIIPGKGSSGNIVEVQWVIYQYFFVFLLSGIILYIAFIISNRRESFGFPDLKQLLVFFKYSLTALAANVIFFLVYRIDYLFVNNSPVCTAADLGNYIQVSKLGQMLLIIPQIVASVIFPRTASGVPKEQLHSSLMKIARLFSQLYVVILLFTIFFGKTLFAWLFGETFNMMQLPFIILIPGIFSLSVLQLLSAYFGGRGKVNVNVVSAILALIVVIVGDYFLVPLYGIVAAAAVSTVGYTVNLAYVLYVFYKDYSVNLVEFFKWRIEDYSWIKSLTIKNK